MRHDDVRFARTCYSLARGVGSSLAILVAVSACVRIGTHPTSIRLETPDHPPHTAAPGSPDLTSALRGLDTLYVPANSASATEQALLNGVRLIRRGAFGEAIAEIAPATADETWGQIAGEILGHLLVHERAWHALGEITPDSSTGGILARVYAAASPETVEFAADSVQLPLFLSRVGTPVLEIVIGDRTRRFWVDTGAGSTVLTESLAAEIGLPLDERTTITVGTATTRVVSGRPVVVPELRLGEAVRVRNHPAIVLDDRALRLRVAGVNVVRIDGILGWPLIRQLDLTLDPAKGAAVVRQPRFDPRGPRNLLWFGYPLLAARAEDGTELLLGLDTGAATTGLTPLFLQAAEVTPTRSTTRRIGSAGGFERVTVQTVHEAAFLLDDRRVRLTRVDVRDRPVTPLAPVHGVIGSDLAAHASLRIDWLNGRFDLIPNDGVQKNRSCITDDATDRC